MHLKCSLSACQNPYSNYGLMHERMCMGLVHMTVTHLKTGVWRKEGLHGGLQCSLALLFFFPGCPQCERKRSPGDFHREQTKQREGRALASLSSEGRACQVGYWTRTLCVCVQGASDWQLNLTHGISSAGVLLLSRRQCKKKILMVFYCFSAALGCKSNFEQEWIFLWRGKKNIQENFGLCWWRANPCGFSFGSLRDSSIRQRSESVPNCLCCEAATCASVGDAFGLCAGQQIAVGLVK